MGVAYNTSVVTNGLVLCLDAANRKGISPLGCEGFSGAPQLIRNIVLPTDVITSFNGVRLGNVNFFTIFAIDYPENTFGGSAASRDGITPGYNVTSGTKIFDFGRALNYAVWNKDTQTWVKTSVYDSYVGTAAVDTFVSEYAVAVQTYPRAIHVVCGSHRDSYHTTAQYSILKDLGAPSNVDSIINFSSPEWILVGEPGLGAGNAYGWAFQNYSTDGTRVAHLNIGLPIYGTKDNYLNFDGTDDKIITADIPNIQSVTYEIVCTKPTQTGYLIYRNANMNYTDNADNGDIYITSEGNLGFHVEYATTDADYTVQANGIISSSTKYYHIVATYDYTSKVQKLYVDGVQVGSRDNSSEPGNVYASNKFFCIGAQGYSNHGGVGIDRNFFNGKIACVKIYNRALSAAEIQQNFYALRGRFGI